MPKKIGQEIQRIVHLKRKRNCPPTIMTFMTGTRTVPDQR